MSVATSPPLCVLQHRLFRCRSMQTRHQKAAALMGCAGQQFLVAGAAWLPAGRCLCCCSQWNGTPLPPHLKRGTEIQVGIVIVNVMSIYCFRQSM